jgi:hypothetical protein
MGPPAFNLYSPTRSVREHPVVSQQRAVLNLAHELHTAADDEVNVLALRPLRLGLSLPGCQIGYMNHAGCHQVVF